MRDLCWIVLAVLVTTGGLYSMGQHPIVSGVLFSMSVLTGTIAFSSIVLSAMGH